MSRRWLNALARSVALRTPPRSRFRPMVEALEDRTVPSVVAVTSALDDGSAGTLRALVAAAAPGDVITFDPSIYGRAIALTAGQITIDKDLTIRGPGASYLTISGNNASGIFNVDGPGILDVTISGLTLSGGNADEGGAVRNADEDVTLAYDVIGGNHASGSGGGVFNQAGGVAIQFSTVSLNTAGAAGGGVSSAGGSVAVSNSVILANGAGSDGGGIAANNSAVATLVTTFYDNIAGGQGGGLDIRNASAPVLLRSTNDFANTAGTDGGGLFADSGTNLTVANCIIGGNTATSGHGGGLALTTATGAITLDQTTVRNNRALAAGGGGVSLDNGGGAGLFVIQDSTLSGNRAGPSSGAGSGDDGGGLLINDAGGRVIVQSTTLANNQAADAGGGIFLRHAAGSVQVLSSTVADNSAQTGGGLTVASGATLTQLESTLVGNNTAGTSAADISAAGVILTATNNLVQNGFSGVAPTTQTGNLIGQDPLLGPLQDNGGPTQTMAPRLGSPAIDAGSNPASLTLDQRGYARVIGTRADIGAIEVDNEPPAASLVFAPAVSAGGDAQYSFTVRFTDNVAVSYNSVVNSTVLVTGPGGFSTQATFVSADVSTDGPAVAASYSFKPPSGSWPPPANGTYTLSLDAGQVLDVSGNSVPPGLLGTFNVNVPGGATSATPGTPQGTYAVGTTGTGLPIVQVRDVATGALKAVFLGLPAYFTGGVNVAMGDVNGDGVPDIIAAAGAGEPPLVNVFDGVTYKLLYSFLAYPFTDLGGVTVASADVNGDGHADIITTTVVGSSKLVEVFSGANGQMIGSMTA